MSTEETKLATDLVALTEDEIARLRAAVRITTDQLVLIEVERIISARVAEAKDEAAQFGDALVRLYDELDGVADEMSARDHRLMTEFWSVTESARRLRDAGGNE